MNKTQELKKEMRQARIYCKGKEAEKIRSLAKAELKGRTEAIEKAIGIVEGSWYNGYFSESKCIQKLKEVGGIE